MRKLVLATLAGALLVASTSAYAGNTTATAVSNANAGAVALGSKQAQGQQTNQGQGINYAPEDNSDNVVNSEPAIAPNLGGLVASPATCMGSTQATAAYGGLFAFGMGSTWTDQECNTREALKLAAHLGLSVEAVQLFMNLDAVQRAGIGQGEAMAVASTETPVTTTVSSRRPAKAPARPTVWK